MTPQKVRARSVCHPLLLECESLTIRFDAFRLLFFFACLLPTVSCLLLLWGCGKKGDPTLHAYEKPDAPTALTAIHRESEIIVSWNFPKSSEQGIKGFHLMKSSNGDFRRIASIERDKRSYRDTDFVIERAYRYKILSENLKGITNESPTLDIRPLPPPPQPSDLSFEVHHDSITIKWRSSIENTFFNIYRSHKKGEYRVAPINEKPVKGESFEDSFDPRHTVYYVVRSLTGSPIWDEGPSSVELTVDPLDFVPSPPQNVIAVPVDDGLYLTWNEPAETWVTGYRVYRKFVGKADYERIGETQIPAFLDQNPLPEKATYRVTAIGPAKEGPPAEITHVTDESSR